MRAAGHRYARRGFRVAVPGFPGRCSIDSSIYLQPFKELQVSVSLLVAELHSEQQTSHSVLYVYVASFQKPLSALQGAAGNFEIACD